jgi:hypothetical protein
VTHTDVALHEAPAAWAEVASGHAPHRVVLTAQHHGS